MQSQTLQCGTAAGQDADQRDYVQFLHKTASEACQVPRSGQRFIPDVAELKREVYYQELRDVFREELAATPRDWVPTGKAARIVRGCYWRLYDEDALESRWHRKGGENAIINIYRVSLNSKTWIFRQLEELCQNRQERLIDEVKDIKCNDKIEKWIEDKRKDWTSERENLQSTTSSTNAEISEWRTRSDSSTLERLDRWYKKTPRAEETKKRLRSDKYTPVCNVREDRALQANLAPTFPEQTQAHTNLQSKVPGIPSGQMSRHILDYDPLRHDVHGVPLVQTASHPDSFIKLPPLTARLVSHTANSAHGAVSDEQKQRRKIEYFYSESPVETLKKWPSPIKEAMEASEQRKLEIAKKSQTTTCIQFLFPLALNADVNLTIWCSRSHAESLARQLKMTLIRTSEDVNDFSR